jgi:UV DNA damage endonuclease
MKFGLVCISEILKDRKISFQTMTRKKFNALDRQAAINDLSKRILHNAKVTGQAIVHCASSSIAHYRVSSALFPLITDSTLNLSYDDLPDYIAICDALKFAGDHARRVGVTLSSHPDQFNVLGSYNQETVDRTIKELNHQAWVLDTMGCEADFSTPMCLHVNKAPDLKVEAITEYRKRFLANFSQCDLGVRRRLVLENEDSGYWNCENLYSLFGMSFPLVYDNHHDDCLPSNRSYIEDFKKTWGSYTPVFHLSEGICGTRSHSDYITKIPECVLNNLDCIWEVEVKAKDKCIIKLLKEASNNENSQQSIN